MMPGRERNPSTSRQVTRSSVVDPHWFQCGSDPAINLNADPDRGSQTNAHSCDPDPGQSLFVTKSSII